MRVVKQYSWAEPCAIALISAIWLIGCQSDPIATASSESERFMGGGSRILKAQKKIPGEYIVMLKDTNTLKMGVTASTVHAAADRLVARHAGTKKRVYNHVIRGFSVRMSEQAAEQLAADPEVAQVEENAVVEANYLQPNATWGLDRIDQHSLPLSETFYNGGLTGQGVNVYVIDSGIRTTHLDFEGRASVGADFIGDGMNGQDECNHGTHVAGTIASRTFGVAKKANVISVRVLDWVNPSCTGSLDTVIAGIDWVTANKIQPAVVNMSLSGPFSEVFNTAIRNSINAGIVHVVAAGNSSTDQLGSPASVSEALVVGALYRNDSLASYSNYGPGVDLFAPGTDVLSTTMFSDISAGENTGTSMASPHVAGMVALYRQANPLLSPTAIHDTIVNSATIGVISNLNPNTPNRLAYVGSDVLPQPQLVENFEAGASQWTIHDGNWALVADGTQTYQGTNTDGYARASYGTSAWTDQTVEARVKAISFNGADRFVVLAARFMDSSNYYYLALRSSGVVELKALQGANPTLLDSEPVSVSTGTWYTLKLEAVGSSLKGYVNGVLKVSATNAAFATGKVAIGVYRGQARFDDVTVSATTVPSGVARDPYPSPSVTNLNTYVPLTWIPGALAQSHDVYFGTTSAVSFLTNQTDNTYLLAGLQNNTTYYWRIDERQSGGTVLQGPVWSFTTGVGIGAASSPSPVNGAVNSSRNPVLSWDLGVNALDSIVYLGLSPASLQFFSFAASGSRMIPCWDLTPNTTYYWRVDETNGIFTTPGQVWSFTTDDGSIQSVPTPATNPLPVDMATAVSLGPTLSWTAGVGATSREVWFGTSLDEYGGLQWVSYQTATTYTPGPLQPNTTYYWQINERNTAGQQPGPIWQFTTGAYPDPATEPSPANNETGVNLTPVLLWTPGAGALSHDVYFGTWVDESGDPPFIGNQSGGGYSASYDPGTLLPNTTYYWRIDERNAAGVRGGTLWQFTTLPAVTTLFSDDFEDGDYSGWTVQNGAWSVVTDGTKVLKTTNTSGYSRISAGSASWTNQSVAASVKPLAISGSDRFIVLAARFQNTSNYYYLAFRSTNTLELKKLVGGTAYTLDTEPVTFTLGTWYDLKLEIVGSNLVGYVNGTPKVSASDSQFSNGNIAVGSYAITAEFDNVLVTQ